MEPLALLMVVEADRARYETMFGYQPTSRRRLPDDLPHRKPAGRRRLRWLVVAVGRAWAARRKRTLREQCLVAESGLSSVDPVSLP